MQFLARRAHHLAFWDGVTPTLVRIYSEARVASDTALFFFQLKLIACTLFFVQNCTICALQFTDRLFLVNDGFTSACFFIFFYFGSQTMLQVQTHLASSNSKPSLQNIAHLASCSFSGYTTANSSSTLVFIKSS